MNLDSKGEVMNEPTMDTLARRLDRVERENRRLKRWVALALAVIFLVGCQQKTEFEACHENMRKAYPEMAEKNPQRFAKRVIRSCSP